MREKALELYSISLLLTGSILMLSAGFGFTTSSEPLYAGFACLLISIFIERRKKKIKTKPQSRGTTDSECLETSLGKSIKSRSRIEKHKINPRIRIARKSSQNSFKLVETPKTTLKTHS